MARPMPMALAAAVAVLALAPGAAAAEPSPTGPPKPIELRAGWEVLDPTTPSAPAQPVTVPSAFEGVARAPQFGGTVKLYRLQFTAPDVEDYRWAFRFEQVRRRATVSLNGRRTCSKRNAQR